MPYPTYTSESLTATQQIGELVGQSNLIATGAPGVNNDCLSGYHVGSRWLNTDSGLWYICSSAAAGEANWVAISGGGSDGPSGPTGPAGPGLTSAEGVSTLTTLGDDTELDITTPGYVYVYTGNVGEGDSHDLGMGTGNSSIGNSGECNIWTGFSDLNSGILGISTGQSANANSGNIGLATGNAGNGNTGDIALTTGIASGTRGKIILDAGNSGVSIPAIGGAFRSTVGAMADPYTENNSLLIVTDDSQTQLYLHSGALANANSNQTGDAWFESGNVVGDVPSGDCGIGSGIAANGGSGAMLVYSGDTTTSNSGEVWISSGSSSGANSGDVHIGTGSADGTRGSIILDSIGVTAPSGLSLQSASNIALLIPSQVADNGDGATITLTAGPGGATSGDGGGVTILSGQASSGNSGDITLLTNTASATRGNIILDAPAVQSSDQSGSTNSNDLRFSSGAAVDGHSGAAYLQSSDTSGAGATGVVTLRSGEPGGDGDSGRCLVYSGDVSGAGNSGIVSLNTGSASTGVSSPIFITTGDSDESNSGNIELTIGAAGAARGSIILDAPLVKLTQAQLTVPAHIEFDVYTPDGGDGADTGRVGLWSGFIGEGDGNSGIVLIMSGNTDTGTTGDLILQTGNAGSGNTGNVTLQSGGSGSGNSGDVTIASNQTFGGAGHSGSVTIQTGDTTAGTGASGTIELRTGSADSTRGNIILDAPFVMLNGIPIGDPHILNAVYNDGGVLKISAGS